MSDIPELFTSLYDELRVLAERLLRRSGAASTLSSTTLVHEVYLDISHRTDRQFTDQAHFIGYAARAMRGITIDHMRRAHTLKRCGILPDVRLLDDPTLADQLASPQGLEALSDALVALAEIDASLAELVDLHFFCGYDLREIAALRGTSERTVQRSWREARTRLRDLMLEQ